MNPLSLIFCRTVKKGQTKIVMLTNFQIFDPNGFQVMSKMLYFIKNGKIIPFTDYHKRTYTFIFGG